MNFMMTLWACKIIWRRTGKKCYLSFSEVLVFDLFKVSKFYLVREIHKKEHFLYFHMHLFMNISNVFLLISSCMVSSG